MAKKEKKAPITGNDSADSEIAKKFKQNPGVYIGSVVVLVLVVITFVGGDFLSGGKRYAGKTNDLTFGYYDNVPISWVPGNILNQYYETTFNNFRAQGYDPNDRWVSYYVWKQAYDRSVIHTAIISMLKKSGYTVSEKAVNKVVLQLPQFQDNGRFSLALYNRMSDSARIALWHKTQEEIAMNVFFSDYFDLLIPESEAKFIANMSSPARSFDFVSFDVDEYPDSEYLSYARGNSNLFDSIQLSKITISSSEREAKKILASIQDGTTTFEDAAKAQSKDSYADRGGDMGVKYCYELDGEIPKQEDREMIYNLGRGELSSVISTNDGWAFFRVENELAKADFDDWSVMDRVRTYVKSYERGRMEDWAVEQANEFIAESQELGYNNAARWKNLGRKSLGHIPLNYGSVELFTTLESFTESGLSADDLKGLSLNETFWKTSFSTPINTPCQPLVQGNNVYVFIPTEEITAEEESVESVVSNYKSQFVQHTSDQSLQKYFQSNGKLTDHFDDIYFNVLSR
jgi:hypothetical protein